MNIATQATRFTASLAQTKAEITSVQQLRYHVFSAEMGGNGRGFDHETGLESDPFDHFADHLLLRDTSATEPSRVIGTYRLLRTDQAQTAGGFYSAQEYDLSNLIHTGAPLLELSRSCILPTYRGGTALLHLWQGLNAYVAAHNIGYLFGVASFSGTNVAKHANALTLLNDKHLAPESLRTRAHGQGAVPLSYVPSDQLDRRAAMIAMPPLIKAYLRMGGVVGDGAYVDEAFQTTDVCMILETGQLSARPRALLGEN